MRAKQSAIRFILLPVLILAGCEKNTVAPTASVEEKINANRPFHQIIVSHPDFNYVFTRESAEPWQRIKDAFADERYFIVITDDVENRTYYFNLFSMKKLETQTGAITITY